MQNNISMSRENNFNILRIIAAIMVMAGHMSFIIGGGKQASIVGSGYTYNRSKNTFSNWRIFDSKKLDVRSENTKIYS